MREINKIGRVPSSRCSEDEESLEESAKEQGKLLTVLHTTGIH